MAKPGVIYRLNWAAFHETDDIQCFVDISDNDNLIDDGDTAEVRPLTPGTVPADLSVIDNDENPFTAIRAQQLTIQFASDYNYSMSTFCTGSDQRWGVHYYIADDTKTVFKGFLVMDDISEPLLAPAEIVTLTATDNLGLLNDIPLTNSDETPLRGKYKIIDLLSKCLAKTGLSLNIRVAFNIKLAGMETDVTIPNATDEHFFSNVYLDSLTFEDELLTLENCYIIIEKIIGSEAVLFQMKGQWWIMRIDEVEHPTRGLYITSFDADGTFDENRGEISFDKEIRKIFDIKLSEEASIVKATRPHKSARLDFEYSYPKEIPFNSRFERGDLQTTISPTQKQYVLEGWRLAQNLSTPVAPSCTTYIERIFDSNGYETEKYVVITSPVAPTSNNFIVSQGIPVHEKDRFSFSVDMAHVSDMTGSGSTYTQRVATIRLVADDATYWMMDIGGTWFQSNSTWSVNFKDLEYQFIPNDIDTTEYVTISADSKDIPRDGTIYIDLYAMNQQVSGIDDVAIKFNNLSFGYNPFINGTYRDFTGQYNKTTQDDPTNGKYKAKVEDDVFVSDSPKKLINGSLLKIDSWYTVHSGTVIFATGNSFQVSGFHVLDYEVGQIIRISTTTSNNMLTRITEVGYSTIAVATVITVEGTTVSETDASTLIESPIFSLANSFYNAAVYTAGVGGDNSLLHPYGHIQLFDVWNQYKNEMRVIQGTMQGLDLGDLDADSKTDIAHLVNKWTMSDSSQHLVNRYFILLSFSQNHDTQGWAGTLREVVNLTKSKDYSNHEFKYIEA